MTNFEPDNGASRDDLVQRVALMETMIAEVLLVLVVAEMFFGLVVFGPYAMWIERRRSAALDPQHA
jgi:hypothetical protein